jgi:hypothetical protein
VPFLFFLDRPCGRGEETRGGGVATRWISLFWAGGVGSGGAVGAAVLVMDFSEALE